MLPYWILFGIVAVLALTRIDFLSIERRNQAGLTVALAAIALMIGLRFQVGGDYENYILIHRDIAHLDLVGALFRTDPGYALFDWIGASLGYGTWPVNLVCAIIFCWGLGRYLRCNPNPYLGLLIAVPYLIIVVAMGYTRQAAALGLIMAGMARFGRSHILYFCAMCLLATLFHKSAIVMLPVGLLALRHNRLVTFGLLLLLGGFLYYVFVASALDTLVNNYVVQAQTSQGAMVRVLMCVPPAILLLMEQRRFRFTEDEGRLYRNFAIATLIALGALLVGVPSTPVDRLALYILPIQLVVLTRMVALVPVDERAALMMTAGIIFLYGVVQFVWLNYAVHAVLWLPYQFLPFS